MAEAKSARLVRIKSKVLAVLTEILVALVTNWVSEKTEHKSRKSLASDENGNRVGGWVTQEILGKLKSPSKNKEADGNLVCIMLSSS